ncbi:Calcineurin-like phosphoesterase [Thomasclavelia cocleata]|uniref:Calcineurin-like phosphoesterase n=2 Tax=Thomasclavelia cocleata TaxID=69824 RepID=A0A1I0D9A2_9FIRM|nr:metallophosphoesterase [Thomasclavelia cocleata]MCR1960420.1 metallophosphoesterase [Thomasclavelia cocleata]NDO41958.1 serine/threonine protein phosphatase [Thomasclavelia cocleata]SET28849.1 Calcineurin-like phosphoesterase [Thomasclavelia cocleata]
MLEVKHVEKMIKGKYRCIVVSDIHSHLDRFKQLLKKTKYCLDDYLVVVGDFIEKGDQAIETVEYLMKLQEKNDKVYVLLGNCEYALEEMVTNPKYAKQIINYLNHIGKGGMIRQAINKLSLNIKSDQPEYIQLKVKEFLQPYFNYFTTLPTTLHFNNFIFVHAGIEKREDWQNSSLSSMIEMKTFYMDGHCLDDYVIVGHLPTSNQYENFINNEIIINNEKRVISIDGGTGVKSISQLNALIITGENGTYTFSKEYVQPLPLYQVLLDINSLSKEAVKIAWPNFEVELLEEKSNFSKCRQINTNKILNIKNEFLYHHSDKVYCLDDYIDYQISLKKGDIVKLVGVYGIYAYVIKNNTVGWVKYRYLKKLQFKHQ